MVAGFDRGVPIGPSKNINDYLSILCGTFNIFLFPGTFTSKNAVIDNTSLTNDSYR